MVSPIFAGGIAGVGASLRRQLGEARDQQEDDYDKFVLNTRANSEVLGEKTKSAQEYNKKLTRIAELIVKDNNNITDFEQAYNIAHNLNINFGTQGVDQFGISKITVPELTAIYKGSDIGGGYKYQLDISNPLIESSFERPEDLQGTVPEKSTMGQRLFGSPEDLMFKRAAKETKLTTAQIAAVNQQQDFDPFTQADARVTQFDAFAGTQEAGVTIREAKNDLLNNPMLAQDPTFTNYILAGGITGQDLTIGEKGLKDPYFSAMYQFGEDRINSAHGQVGSVPSWLATSYNRAATPILIKYKGAEEAYIDPVLKATYDSYRDKNIDKDKLIEGATVRLDKLIKEGTINESSKELVLSSLNEVVLDENNNDITGFTPLITGKPDEAWMEKYRNELGNATSVLRPKRYMSTNEQQYTRADLGVEKTTEKETETETEKEKEIKDVEIEIEKGSFTVEDLERFQQQGGGEGIFADYGRRLIEPIEEIKFDDLNLDLTSTVPETTGESEESFLVRTAKTIDLRNRFNAASKELTGRGLASSGNWISRTVTDKSKLPERVETLKQLLAMNAEYRTLPVVQKWVEYALSEPQLAAILKGTNETEIAQNKEGGLMIPRFDTGGSLTDDPKLKLDSSTGGGGPTYMSDVRQGGHESVFTYDPTRHGLVTPTDNFSGITLGYGKDAMGNIEGGVGGGVSGEKFFPSGSSPEQQDLYRQARVKALLADMTKEEISESLGKLADSGQIVEVLTKIGKGIESADRLKDRIRKGTDDNKWDDLSDWTTNDEWDRAVVKAFKWLTGNKEEDTLKGKLQGVEGYDVEYPRSGQ